MVVYTSKWETPCCLRVSIVVKDTMKSATLTMEGIWLGWLVHSSEVKSVIIMVGHSAGEIAKSPRSYRQHEVVSLNGHDLSIY